MHFFDLTPYTYHRPHVEPDTLNVGWLGAGFSFSTGEARDDFLDRLFDICRDKWFKTHRGFHTCEFCDSTNVGPREVERNGTEARLGYAEIRVRHPNGRMFASPTLIYHYVVEHGYAPPVEFVEAVLHGNCPHPFAPAP